jgi:predicted NUDIX family NTP pyrophosphohydrolase
VFLVHPGGPFWARRDDGAWSIPKGEIEPGHDPLDTACREFREETGFVDLDFPTVVALAPVKQAGGKIVHAWAAEGDCDPSALRSNTFVLHGRTHPEVDRAGWFALDEGRRKILASQRPLLDQLEQLLLS